MGNNTSVPFQDSLAAKMNEFTLRQLKKMRKYHHARRAEPFHAEYARYCDYFIKNKSQLYHLQLAARNQNLNRQQRRQLKLQTPSVSSTKPSAPKPQS